MLVAVEFMCLFYGGYGCTLLIEELPSNKRNDFSRGVNYSRL
jgi:hypothetical protein